MFLALLVFCILLGTTFWSVQWFSNSVKGFLFLEDKPEAHSFSGSPQTNAANITDAISTAVPAILGESDKQNAQESLASPQGIQAAAAFSLRVSDTETAVLFSQEENKKLPIASLAKLMTALIVLERYDLTHETTISEKAMEQEGDQGNLKVGEKFSVRDLLYITLIESSNRAAYALAEMMGNNEFVAAMNTRARDLKMSRTHFEDSTGINFASQSSAHDVATLSRYLFENYTLFREIISLKEFDLYLANGTFHHNLVNTNKLLGEATDVVGGKTGWTNQARGCFMAITARADSSEYTIYVILGAEDRLVEMRKLIQLNLN